MGMWRIVIVIIVVGIVGILAIFMTGGPRFNTQYAEAGAKIYLPNEEVEVFSSLLETFAKEHKLTLASGPAVDHINITMDAQTGVGIRIFSQPRSDVFHFYVYSPR